MSSGGGTCGNDRQSTAGSTHQTITQTHVFVHTGSVPLAPQRLRSTSPAACSNGLSRPHAATDHPDVHAFHNWAARRYARVTSPIRQWPRHYKAAGAVPSLILHAIVHMHGAPCPSPSIPSHRHQYPLIVMSPRLHDAVSSAACPVARPALAPPTQSSRPLDPRPRPQRVHRPPHRYSDEYTAATPAAAAASPNATSCGSFSRNVPASAPRVDLRLARSCSYSRKAFDLKADSPS